MCEVIRPISQKLHNRGRLHSNARLLVDDYIRVVRVSVCVIIIIDLVVLIISIIINRPGD